MIGRIIDMPPIASYVLLGRLLVRLLVPALLITLAARGATPAQRISLVRDYLTC
jgi:hypothetical protein